MIDFQKLSERLDQRVAGLTNRAPQQTSFSLRDEAMQSIRNVLRGRTKDSKTKTLAPIEDELPFDSTKMGIALNTILGIPEAAVKVGKEIFQGTARGLSTLGRDPKEMVDPKETPAGKLFGAKRFFGTEEPFSLESETRPFSQVISEKFGFDEEKTQKVLVPFMGALNALDLLSGGGKRKAIEESIKTVVDINGARRIFKDVGISDEVIDTLKLDSRAVATKTNEEAAKLIDEVVAKTKDDIARGVQTNSAVAKSNHPLADQIEIPDGGIVARRVAEPRLDKAQIPDEVVEAARRSADIDEFVDSIGDTYYHVTDSSNVPSITKMDFRQK